MKSLTGHDRKVLRAVFALAHPTRSSVAGKTGLSLVKVSSILAGLENRGRIQKAGTIRATGGRPAYLFRLAPELGVFLGVSVSLDRFHLVGIDGSERLLIDREYGLTLPTDPERHAEAIVEQIAAAMREAVSADESRLPVVSVGLALPGMVDTRRGIWLLGLQVTGISRFEIARVLGQRVGLPVCIEDVSRALTFLEVHKKLESHRNFVLVYLGMGLGTGVVINGRIYRGFHGMAGEIGHIEHADNSYRCSCNNVGCLETVVSTTGILRVFSDRLKEGVRSSLQKLEFETENQLTLERILQAAAEGDRLARSTLGEIGVFLGDACATMIKLFNPEKLIVSGPGSIFKEYLREPVEQVIQRRVLPEMLVDFETLFADYHPYQEALGAALLALGRYLRPAASTATAATAR